jgi:uncharacterized protein (DUF2336 family)
VNKSPANDPISYDEAKKLAGHEDPEVRLALAVRDDVKAEILYYMAKDPSPEVRRKIATNAAAPHQAHLLLVEDDDEGVRTSLADKIAKLTPGLSPDEQDKLRRSTIEALEILARDQVTRVRQILSDTLKDVANAPPHVIKRLAQDAELVVAGPVLEFSPVLTDEDLIEIIESPSAQGALGAISRRSLVNERVAEAVAATDDVDAIADLLANPSAQIREQTLDNLIDRASAIDQWHAPLVRRPKLPKGAAKRLAHFVADNLLVVLRERQDLDASMLEEVETVVRRRIEEEKPIDAEPLATSPMEDEADPPYEVAERMKKSGKLTDEIIAQAAAADDRAFVLAALAVRIGVAQGVVFKIFATHSAKGVVAVTWKAGLPMSMAVQFQEKFARIKPEHLLAPSEGNGYPLSDEEMQWQIDFFSDTPAAR